ncbi:ABC transporter ATP-binding protein [Fundicoccus culcitae]|uniref:ABC transporter ATP-binding protein n=1 Tax=Fundicoccus culcitae TaxID=2969821 RepID=A0ABY5P9D8_9LACT|nr:ABC transporter ATP-binding protein [Fundicoccus culcitae]UUX34980.1 ABC transporter ATP-binding protein [Fundicoccus culcitae]
MSNAILSVNNLSISFGGLKAVDDLTFEINEGEIYGLIGPNGAGKTTVFNCITQFYKPDSGEAIFRNGSETINLMDLKVHDVIKYGIVRTFQNVEVVRELTILENVLIGAHKEYKSNLLQQIFPTKKVLQEEADNIEKAEGILDQFGLLHLKDSPVGSQSYGIRKKVEFARALMSNPKLIILDEPAAGLNDRETEEFAQLIVDIRKQYDLTILLIEHDMGLVMGICDRICAINFGRLLTIGSPKDIQNNEEVQSAYLGVDS